MIRLLPRAHTFQATRTLPAGRRGLSSRAAQVLSALDLPTDGSSIPGVYDGRWGGTGPAIESKCPATGEVIGRVSTVSICLLAKRLGAE